MRWVTHVVAATSLAALTMNPVFTAVAAGFSIAPDLLENRVRTQVRKAAKKKYIMTKYRVKVKHRNRVTHNFAAGLAILSLYPFLGTISLAMAFGYIHHLILDATTKYGVFFFNKRIHGKMSSMSTRDNVIVAAVHLIPVILILSLVFL